MPFLAYDLDALENAAQVARAAGIAEDTAIAGNARMWRYCWQQKTDRVDAAHLAGFYGTDKVVKPLASFGFIEPDGTMLYRVRGAERYLRISKAKSAGGKASASSRQRDQQGRLLPSSAPAEHQQTASSQPALPPSIEHRAPKKDSSSSGGPAFFARVQEARRTHGFTTERAPNPRDLGAFFSEALMELNGDEGRLWGAYEHFAESEHWKRATPPWPFTAFMKLWRDFVPRRQAS